jgi:hypothetical protein
MWLSSGCSVAQFRVRRGSVQGAAWLSWRVRRCSVEGAAWVSHFKFFQKLAEIFAAQGAPPVSNGKIFSQKSFHYFF